MTLLLYITLIYGVDAGSTTNTLKTITSKPVYGHQESSSKDINSKTPKDSSVNYNVEGISNPKADLGYKKKNPCPDIHKCEETSKTFIREEKKIIHNIIKATRTNTIWTFPDLDLAVVKTNLNTTESHIDASELFNDTQAAQIWIPVEIFRNVSGEEHKVGVVSYKSSEQFTVEMQNTDEEHWTFMSYISYIGCGLSAVFSGCSILTFIINSCWTTGDSIPYAVNISYFALIFLFNIGILITVSVKIFMLQKADNKRKTANVFKYVSTVLGLMCLLGITWGLVFFTSGYTNYPILYLFCILNSMQGFYIFLWMCLTARPKRQQADKISTFTVDTTDSYKQRSLSS
ncbi:G-protein coupled receptor G5 [Triplophysa tibetana]|uniref:G-protein coupled receptor G5 n=1 Tax=Triplophysa tibetana TaxID=1572043 RepID=A0A5A9PRT7_9TELE|nr:G-protein coupled receptor G5 [Triplophysa tibetana]